MFMIIIQVLQMDNICILIKIILISCISKLFNLHFNEILFHTCQLFTKTLEWDFVRGDQNYATHAASQVGGSDIRELELIWCCTLHSGGLWEAQSRW